MASNVDGALPHEADYRPLEDAILRGLPRPMVARLAANFLAKCFSIEVLQAIHQDGYDKFRALAGELYANHEFREEDYRAIFDIVGIALKDRLMKREGITV